MTLDTNAYGLWLANEFLQLIDLYNVYISITNSVLPPYWILYGLLGDITIICLHTMYWMF